MMCGTTPHNNYTLSFENRHQSADKHNKLELAEQSAFWVCAFLVLGMVEAVSCQLHQANVVSSTAGHIFLPWAFFHGTDWWQMPLQTSHSHNFRPVPVHPRRLSDRHAFLLTLQ